MPPLSGPRKASYLIFAAGLLAAVRFDLGPSLLAGLASYTILDLTERRLRAGGAPARLSRAAAVGVFAVTAAALGWTFFRFLRVGLERLPALLDAVLPRLAGLSAEHGLDFPADNAREMRDFVVAAAKENVRQVGAASGLLTRGFLEIAAGIFVAVMRFLAPPPPAPEGAGSLYAALREETGARAAAFLRSFERVVGAQFLIALVNTALTSVFLLLAGFPFSTFLILTTFVCGFIPILGNVASNTVIVAAGLTVSTRLAASGLAYLVAIHKLEYLLNSRIVGGSIDTPAWATLAGVVAGEAFFGVPGALLAPALIHYAREELRALPA